MEANVNAWRAGLATWTGRIMPEAAGHVEFLEALIADNRLSDFRHQQAVQLLASLDPAAAAEAAGINLRVIAAEDALEHTLRDPACRSCARELHAYIHHGRMEVVAAHACGARLTSAEMAQAWETENPCTCKRPEVTA